MNLSICYESRCLLCKYYPEFPKICKNYTQLNQFHVLSYDFVLN